MQNVVLCDTVYSKASFEAIFKSVIIHVRRPTNILSVLVFSLPLLTTTFLANKRLTLSSMMDKASRNDLSILG